MPRAIARIASRPTRSSTAPTATMASPGAVVRSNRTAPASSSAATARPATGRSGTTRADSLACAVSARISALTPRRSSRRRASDRSSAGRSPPARNCSEMAAAANRARWPSAAASAVAMSSPAAARRPASANASPAAPPAVPAATRARSALRPAPSSAATRRSASGSSRSSARSLRTAAEAPDERGGHGLRTRPARQAGQRREACEQGGDHAGRPAAQRVLDGRPRDELPRSAMTLDAADRDQPALAVAAADDLHDDIEGRSDLLTYGRVRQLEPSHEREQLDAPERVLRAFGVHRGE